MAHVLFVDMSQAGLLTMAAAVDLGHEVTYVRGGSFVAYTADESYHRLLARLTEVIDVVDTFDLETLVTTIAELTARRPVDAVISQCDPMMPALAQACELLSLRFTSARGVGNARDKAAARRILATAGVPSARFEVVHTADEASAAAARIGGPVVVKPRSGIDSMLASHAATPTSAAEAAEAIVSASAAPDTPHPIQRMLAAGILVEEYLPGELVSAEIGVLDGRTYRFLVCGRSRGRKNDCVEVGAVLPAHLPQAEVSACFDYAERVCALLGLDFGVFHVELMLTAHGPVLVEVNPRMMGGVMARLYEILVGKDFCEYVIDLHLGRPPAAAGPMTSRTVTARRIMPANDAVLPATANLSWLDSPGTGIVNFENFGIRPGTTVRRQQVLGRYAVLADDWAAAMRTANDLMPRFADSLGIDLIEPAAIGRNTTGGQASADS